MKVIPAELERGWRLAEARGVLASDAVAADPLDVQLNGEAVMVGIDAAGARHLLIPLPPEVDHGGDSAGSAISLRVRPLVIDAHEQHFLDLMCSRPDLFDEFAVLSSEVVEAVVKSTSAPAEATAAVLKAWRELLRSISAPRLDRGGVIGLFAELSVLDRVLSVSPQRGVESWTGPDRARHDFGRGDVVVEVKGSTARRGRPLVVHGIDQLEAPPNATLYLVWIALEVGVERGESLRALVDRLLTKTLDPTTLERRLHAYGYDFHQPEAYESPLLSELDLRWYVVGDDFPRLTRSNLVAGQLPRGVLSVSYEVDLSGDHPPVLADAEVGALIHKLAGMS
jgi:putative PD-(D/E)XK family protein DUF4420